MKPADKPIQPIEPKFKDIHTLPPAEAPKFKDVHTLPPSDKEIVTVQQVKKITLPPPDREVATEAPKFKDVHTLPPVTEDIYVLRRVPAQDYKKITKSKGARITPKRPRITR